METHYLNAIEELNEWIDNNIPQVNAEKVIEATSIVDWLMQKSWAKNLQYQSWPDGNPHRVYDGLKTVLEILNYLFVYIIQVRSVYHDKIIKLMREVNENDEIEEQYRLKIEKIKEIINS